MTRRTYQKRNAATKLCLLLALFCVVLVVVITKDEDAITTSDLKALETCLAEVGGGEKCVVEIKIDDNDKVGEVEIIRKQAE